MAKNQSTSRDRSKLSERQRRILNFIEGFIEDNGYPPTIRDIGKAVNIGSTSVVNYNLNKLVKEGFLERSKKVSRGLLLVRNEEEIEDVPVRVVDSQTVPVALAGQIVASRPVEFFDDAADEDEAIEVPLTMLGKVKLDEVFALRVKGYSMIDAMIGDGDIVVLRRQKTAQDKDMVAVWLRGSNETTLKYFFREGQKIRLQPANPQMEAIYVDADDVEVQGRVLAVLRTV